MTDARPVSGRRHPSPPGRRPIAGHPLVQLVLVRVREFIREPEAVFWALFFPILLTVGLGVAFGTRRADVLPVATPSPAIAESLRREPALDVRELAEQAARDALRTGRVVLLVEPDAASGVVYRYDDTNPQGGTARLLADRVIQHAGGRTDPVPARNQVVREAGSRYIDFVVPGLVGLGIMSNTLWGLGFSIVDARRRKLIKRLMATPMSRAEYLASFVISRFFLLVFEILLLVGFSVVAFGVPLRGSLVQLGVICALGALSFGALGLLVAARPRTVEGASGLMNLVMMPMWILSGVFFSSENFPRALQPVIQALPLTAVNDALRANMLRGAGLDVVGPELAIIAAWCVVCFVLALRLFRWR